MPINQMRFLKFNRCFLLYFSFNPSLCIIRCLWSETGTLTTPKSKSHLRSGNGAKYLPGDHGCRDLCAMVRYGGMRPWRRIRKWLEEMLGCLTLMSKVDHTHACVTPCPPPPPAPPSPPPPSPPSPPPSSARCPKLTTRSLSDYRGSNVHNGKTGHQDVNCFTAWEGFLICECASLLIGTKWSRVERFGLVLVYLGEPATHVSATFAFAAINRGVVWFAINQSSHKYPTEAKTTKASWPPANDYISHASPDHLCQSLLIQRLW